MESEKDAFSKLGEAGGGSRGNHVALSACGGGKSNTPATTAAGESTTSAKSSAPSGQLNLGVAYETTNYDPSTTSSALAMGTNWHG